VSPLSASVVGRKAIAERGYVQARLAWYAKDERPGPSEVTTPGATVVDLGGGWRAGQYVELRALARNVFDETYYSSPDPRWVYAAGRSVSLTASLRF
jgi:outer membrane receptor protein involved in Fe transport